MPAITRLGDYCTGHDCHPPRPSTQGSPDVFVNGIPVHRVGDLWGPHSCDGPPHTSILIQGAPGVLVNGQPVGRVGDLIACGSFVATGSPDVIVGEG